MALVHTASCPGVLLPQQMLVLLIALFNTMAVRNVLLPSIATSRKTYPTSCFSHNTSRVYTNTVLSSVTIQDQPTFLFLCDWLTKSILNCSWRYKLDEKCGFRKHTHSVISRIKYQAAINSSPLWLVLPFHTRVFLFCHWQVSFYFPTHPSHYPIFSSHRVYWFRQSIPLLCLFLSFLDGCFCPVFSPAGVFPGANPWAGTAGENSSFLALVIPWTVALLDLATYIRYPSATYYLAFCVMCVVFSMGLWK